MTTLQNWQKAPFFKRPLAAASFHAATAILLVIVCFADRLTVGRGDFMADGRAPITLRTVHPSGIGEHLVVERGQRLTPVLRKQALELLDSSGWFNAAYPLGVGVFYFLALVLYNLVVSSSSSPRLLRFRPVVAQLITVVLTLSACRAELSLSGWSSFACPLLLTPLLFTGLLPRLQLLALHLLLVALYAPMITAFRGAVLVPLAAGWTTILLAKRESGLTGAVTALAAGLCAGEIALASLHLLSGDKGVFGLSPDGSLAGFAVGTGISAVGALVFYRPISELFGEIGLVRLRRLLELDAPVLKELAAKAPGTFQHSLAMANMAEKVAEEIDADGDLVRAGAYYHDIGKMRQPELFIENQRDSNPHDQLPPERSAELIRKHIADGVLLARAAGIPQRIVDFIVEHHGRSEIEYFLDKARRQGERPVLEKFQYDGRNPTSRETAILMIVDSVEAASRTITEPTAEKIEQMVRTIIFKKLGRGLLDDSGLNTRDLRLITTSLVEYLRAQFHQRVPYPWQRQQEQQAARVPTDPSMRVATPVTNPRIETVPANETAAEPSQQPPAMAPDPEGPTGE